MTVDNPARVRVHGAQEESHSFLKNDLLQITIEM